MLTAAPKVQSFLQENSEHRPDQYAVLVAVRAAILVFDPAIEEQFKYGGILFGAPKQSCGLFSYANHVSLEFSEGAALPDEGKLLEGSGKLRRHIKLMTTEDIEPKRAVYFIELALNASRLVL